jgi:hypothetical protein
MSTPLNFHFPTNCCSESMKALRFSFEFTMSENVVRVAPGSENSKPPMPIHLEMLSGSAMNCL